MSTEVCAVISGKGGVGKTTLSYYLATILAGGKNRAVVIDLNIGLRGLDVLFRHDDDLVYDLGDILTDKCSNYHYALMDCNFNKNLYGIAAPSNPFFRIDFDKFYALIGVLKRDFNYVFLDSPSSICAGFMSAVSLCDRVIVMATPDPLSAASSSKIGEYVRNADISAGHLVINGVNFKARRPPVIGNFETIIDMVGFPLLGVLPFEERLLDSALKGKMVPKRSSYVGALYNMAKRYNYEDADLFMG